NRRFPRRKLAQAQHGLEGSTVRTVANGLCHQTRVLRKTLRKDRSVLANSCLAVTQCSCSKARVKRVKTFQHIKRMQPNPRVAALRKQFPNRWNNRLVLKLQQPALPVKAPPAVAMRQKAHI